MVCTANICRSPMARIVAQHMAEQSGWPSREIHIDSAGTHASKTSTQPDSRAKNALEKRGYKVKKGRSRKIDAQDFERFDLILAMDRTNLGTLQALCPAAHQHKLKLLLEPVSLSANPGFGDEVPDPYYGNLQGFERVLDLCEAGVRGWFARLS